MNSASTTKMIPSTAVNAGVARGLGSSRLAAFPRTSAQQQQRRVVMRLKESDNESDLQKDAQTSLQDVQQELGQLPISSQPTGNKLTPEQLQQVGCAVNACCQFVTQRCHVLMMPL
jgi:hypothetical protein